MNNQENKETGIETTTDEKVPVSQVFSRFPTGAEWNTLNTIAATLKNGGVMPKGIDTLPKMVVALQTGRELGLQPIEALNSIYFVNGKPSIYGEAVPLQIMRAGHTIKWGKCNSEEATVTIIRGDNGNEMTQTFTMAEARERGYTSNPIYKKYPENMLKWRVLGMVAKFIAPDALHGIGIKEDMEAEIVQVDSKFHDKNEAERVEVDVQSGNYGQRPSLNDTLNQQESAPDDTEPEIFSCEECEKEYTTESNLKRHIKTKHENDGE